MSRAKDYLQKVKADEDARAACENQIAALESCAYRITQFYGVRTRSGGAVNSDDKIARLMDAKTECEAIIKSMAEYKAECIRLINELENGTYRLLGLSYSTYFSVINGEYRLSEEKMESVRERYEEVQADTIAGVDPCERLYRNADY